jgi:acetylornithine/succinyldiaminopimelate/putrescine aminotransferase
VLVTVGASEAIAAAVLGLVEPGSEVLVLEPFFDTYAPVIAMAGSHRVAVPLVPNGRGFALDVDAVRAAITPRTRAIIVNSPHNPTGLVLSGDELAALAAVAVARHLGMKGDEIRGALAAFGGVNRRFTKVGEVGGVTIIDDYGHHPVEIAAVLKAARQATQGRVIRLLPAMTISQADVEDGCDRLAEAILEVASRG